jgi:Fe-S cluster assembly protein SufD
MGLEVAPVGVGGDKLSGPGTPPPRSAADRLASLDASSFPVPTGREEEWRFTPLKRLRGLLEPLPGGGDGKVVVEVDAPEDVEVRRVRADDPAIGSVLVPTERVSALARAGVRGALVVRVPADATPDRPVWVTVRGEGGSTYGHVVVDVEHHARAVVVMDHVGTTTLSANLEIRVGDGASLTLVSLQDWDDDAVHLAHHSALVGRDATFRGAVVSLGGDVVRINPSVRFAGPGGSAELLGLYFADGGQHLEHRLFVDHGEPHCRSRVTYKGAVQGQDAHAVWVGDVLIRGLAVGTDTYEENRNLLLTDGARADSVPNLEIETGEVAGAGHASTTGRFDDEQLFYLMSRGIEAAEARRLVVRGFFADIVDRIGVPEVRDRLLAAVEDELAPTPLAAHA